MTVVDINPNQYLYFEKDIPDKQVIVCIIYDEYKYMTSEMRYDIIKLVLGYSSNSLFWINAENVNGFISQKECVNYIFRITQIMLNSNIQQKFFDVKQSIEKFNNLINEREENIDLFIFSRYKLSNIEIECFSNKSSLNMYGMIDYDNLLGDEDPLIGIWFTSSGDNIVEKAFFDICKQNENIQKSKIIKKLDDTDKHITIYPYGSYYSIIGKYTLDDIKFDENTTFNNIDENKEECVLKVFGGICNYIENQFSDIDVLTLGTIKSDSEYILDNIKNYLNLCEIGNYL